MHGAAVIVPVIIWIACAFGGYKIMEGKGRSPVLGLILGLILGIIGLLICLVFPRSAAKKAEAQGNWGPPPGANQPPS